MPKSLPDDPKAWKTLASKYLFQKPWLTMRQDRVELPNGGVIDEFFIWEYPAWVNVIPVTDTGEIVLIRQFRYGVKDVYYELCAGVVDSGEELLVAAKRELLEETGYGGGSWTPFMQLCANPAIQNNITHTFLATGVSAKQAQALETTEEITVHLVSPKDVLKLIDDGEIMQALHAAPLMKYLYSLK
jgi:8-oxo-dGDP phosphatase